MPFYVKPFLLPIALSWAYVGSYKVFARLAFANLNLNTRQRNTLKCQKWSRLVWTTYFRNRKWLNKTKATPTIMVGVL